MSIFPAYAEEVQKDEVAGKTESTWLENSSFSSELCLTSVVNITQCPEQSKKRKIESGKKKNKGKEKISKQKSGGIEEVNQVKHTEEDCFKIELKGHKEYFNLQKLYPPAAPKYSVKYYLCKTVSKRRKNKFKRYFDIAVPTKKNLDESKAEENSTNFNIDRDKNFTGFKQEEELSQKTASFNHHLNQYPCDVEKWLEYVKFQDTIYQFEKSYRKGSMAKAQRVLADRKLAIIDKALISNPDCELLHRERLNIAVNTYPSDELQTHLKTLVEKDKSNIILWQGYIEATQCSMSHCNTPSVMGLYTKCLSTLHQLRRSAVLERHVLEENILRMLYQCGLFLKQAGLFEQLWTLLRMYLELNLSPNDKTKFNVSSVMDEKQLLELEELVFTSQLPLHELWLRIEKLRESCHWLPYLDEDSCEDPQRLVFTEDVAELIHPITTSENIFKLTATVFTLLKIPLLPCRHTTMQELGLDYVPWNLDSIESLLSMFLPLHPIDVTSNFLNDSKLAVGPQYLKSIPGQEEYLKFILLVMKNCSDCLTGEDKVAVTIWYFRFQRLLMILHKLKRFNMSDQLKKTIKKSMKDFLKKEENRQNELYYLEYALLEKELSNDESCVNIILTALKFNNTTVIKTKEWSKSQENRCHIYRILIELKLKSKQNYEEILHLLCELVMGKNCGNISSEVIDEAVTRFRLITAEILMQDLVKLRTLQHFFPNFLTDWIICTGWFIYIKNGISSFIQFADETLSKLEQTNSAALWEREVLNEFYVTVLFKHTVENSASGCYEKLKKVLFKAIENYPNNLFLLAALAKQQSMTYSAGPSWWQVQNLLIKSGRALSTLFAVIILNEQTMKLIDLSSDPVTGQKGDINLNSKNRMLSLFKKITKRDMNTRRCGLIWRLYLQFVYTYCSSELCRNVYYSAVEDCPWLKALYIDAAIYIPTELPQIQDLIIEKQLRLHVTPEELDILRN